MAVTKLTTEAPEEGTYSIIVGFTDEDGDAMSPTTLSWSLVNMFGNVINERELVSIDAPSSSETIVLYGDDLALSGIDRRRRLTLIGTYDSTYGSDLPLTAECEFRISQFIGVE